MTEFWKSVKELARKRKEISESRRRLSGIALFRRELERQKNNMDSYRDTRNY